MIGKPKWLGMTPLMLANWVYVLLENENMSTSIITHHQA